MQRLIKDIRDELMGEKARGSYTQEQLRRFYKKKAWERGVCNYAGQLFEEYLERRGFTDYDLIFRADEIRIGKIKEADLLNGAKDWSQYSHGGCALIYNEDICKALCNQNEQKRTRNGALPPNENEDWLDVQARALTQAAERVLAAVNRREKKV